MIYKKNIIGILFVFVLLLSSAVSAAIVDTDGDYMSDNWEISYGLDPYDASDAFDDKDNDGYLNLEEYGAATEPSNSSSHPGILSAVGLTMRGKHLLENQELFAANYAFMFAVEASPAHQEANFFYALTRLASSIVSNEEGADHAKLESVKELMDSFGISQAGRSLYEWTADFQRDDYGDTVLPATAPTVDDIEDFLIDYVIPELDGALDNLGKVTYGFQTALTPMMFNEGDYGALSVNDDAEVDYTDVVFFRAALHSLKAFLYTVTAYDSNEFDIDAFVLRARSVVVNINQVFEEYPKLLLIKRTGNFALAKSQWNEAIDSYFEASNLLRAETDDQLNDLISIDPDDMADEEEFRFTLEDIEAAMSGPANIRPDDPGFRDHTGDYITADLTRFFDSPFHIRDYLPQFVANIPCSVPDPTFNGMFPNLSHDDWGDTLKDFNDITVFSDHWYEGYYAGIFVDDEHEFIESVTAVGPGISGTMSLVYESGDGYGPSMWWHTYTPFLGSDLPGDPQTYTVTVTDAYGSCSHDKTIAGYVEEFATYLYPLGDVSGEINFKWKGISSAEYYAVDLSDSSGDWIWSSYDSNHWLNNINYYGPSLTPGETYSYVIRSARESDDVINYSFAEETFTFTGYSQPSDGSISGRVLYADTGLPVTYTTVYVHTAQNTYADWYRYARTDSSGYYTANNLSPGYYSVEAMKNGDYSRQFYNNVYSFDSANPILVTAGENIDGIDFSLLKGGSISGRVTAGDTGLPISNIYVSAYGYSDWNLDGSDASTDADGYYSITGLQHGSYRVAVYGNGTYNTKYYNNSFSWSNAKPVQVDLGQETGPIDFSMGQGYECHSYDTDNDWSIGDFELLDAIDDWADGILDDFPLLDLIDYWTAGSYCWDEGGASYAPGVPEGIGTCTQ